MFRCQPNLPDSQKLGWRKVLDCLAAPRLAFQPSWRLRIRPIFVMAMNTYLGDKGSQLLSKPSGVWSVWCSEGSSADTGYHDGFNRDYHINYQDITISKPWKKTCCLSSIFQKLQVLNYLLTNSKLCTLYVANFNSNSVWSLDVEARLWSDREEHLLHRSNWGGRGLQPFHLALKIWAMHSKSHKSPWWLVSGKCDDSESTVD